MKKLLRVFTMALGAFAVAQGCAQAQTMAGCNSVASYDGSASGLTQVIPAAGNKVIMICGFDIVIGATATQVQFEYGMGSNCASSTVALTPSFRLAANGVMIDHVAGQSGLTTTPGNAVCINTSAANPVQALVYYQQY